MNAKFTFPPTNFSPESLEVMGISDSRLVLFSIAAVHDVGAAYVSRMAFDQTEMCVGGTHIRLEGAATIQDALEAGRLIVRSGFVPVA